MAGLRYLTRDEQCILAWSLVELTRPHLPRRERIRLVTMLGAGEIEHVLLDALDYCTEAAIDVPDSLLTPLHHWVCGYRGTPMERTLGNRIDALRPQPNRHGGGGAAEPAV